MRPLFIDSPSGALFAVYWPPLGASLNKVILHVPAFAEEMNKSRHMVALQAKTLSNQGYAMLVVDLLGTGDSSGDFGEATWQIWLQNIADAINWLKEQGAQSVSLWGLRLGALLAMDFSSQNPGVVDRLLLWQPVLNGDVFVTQFLRLRVATAMMNSAMPQEKTSDMKKQLLNGQALEVAGYTLNPDLICPLLGLKADHFTSLGINEIVIFELVARDNSELSIVNQQFLTKLHTCGINAFLHPVVGESFWASQEIVTAPNLLQLTNEKVSQWL